MSESGGWPIYPSLRDFPSPHPKLLVLGRPWIWGKKPPERERERSQAASPPNTTLFSLQIRYFAQYPQRGVFVLVFFFWLQREPKLSFSLTLSLSLPLSLLGSPTLSPSILRISLSYFYAFRGSVILSLSLSLVHFQICSVFCSSVSICFSLDSTLKIGSTTEITHLGFTFVFTKCLETGIFLVPSIVFFSSLPEETEYVS